MTHRWALDERAALVDALEKVGPDAPTLCDGWAARDLAAHVYVRERRPDAALGVLPLGPLSAYTNRVMASVLRVHGYEEILRRLREVAPILRVTRLDEAVNVVEFLIHTEDVRRPNGFPFRSHPDEFEQKIWSRLRRQARLSFGRVPLALRLEPTVGGAVDVGRGGERLTVRGAPSELLMLAFNRKADARVEYDGPADAIETLQRAKIGL